MDPAPPPSERLVKAALAERRELDRHAVRLAAAQKVARDHLTEIERGLAEVAERRALLERLALRPDPNAAKASNTNKHDQADDVRAGGTSTENPLSGPAIRKTAVRTLLRDPHAALEGIHYRQWFETLIDLGYEVAGKDPLAVFLTQISRSPVVHKTSRPGVYRLDQDAVSRLRTQLEDLDQALREIGTITSTSTEDIQFVRTRRMELRAEINQTERALEEAFDVLQADPVYGQPR